MSLTACRLKGFDVIDGERFWEAYESFDFIGLASEVRCLTLAEAYDAEKRTLGWGLVTLSGVVTEVITATYAAADRSPKSFGAAALSSIALAISYLRTRHWSNEADQIPVI